MITFLFFLVGILVGVSLKLLAESGVLKLKKSDQFDESWRKFNSQPWKVGDRIIVINRLMDDSALYYTGVIDQNLVYLYKSECDDRDRMDPNHIKRACVENPNRVAKIHIERLMNKYQNVNIEDRETRSMFNQEKEI